MSGNFSISNDEILDPNGQVWKARGTDVLDSTFTDLVNSGALLQSFPDTNFVRVAMESGYNQPDSNFVNAVNELTSKGIVVVICNYNNPTANAETGGGLQNEVSWFSQLAGTFKNNPYVWFNTDNEAQDNAGQGTVAAEQTAAYQAIRNAGDNSIIALSPNVGQKPDLGSMTNVIWDQHQYGFTSNFSTDPNVLQADIMNNYTNGGGGDSSADGVIPSIISEFGNSTAGNDQPVDANGTQNVQAVLDDSMSGPFSGYAAWLYNWPGTSGDADNLVDPNTGQLTDYGQQVVTADAKYASSAPPPPPPPAPPPGPPPPPPPAAPPPPPPPPGSTTVVTPGNGSFTDAAGNTYSIDAAGNADENGKPMAGGAGTKAMEFANGQVYGQDVNSGTWYTWNQTDWTQSAAPPAPSSAPPPPPPPPAPPPAPPPPPPPSGSTPYITPGNGSFTDAAGNVYTIDAATNADENGKPIAGGYGTKAMELYNGAVYGQDINSGSWYTWNQTDWTAASAPPAPSSAPPPPPPPPAAPPPPPPPSAAILNPGDGHSFTDNSGNVYTLTANDDAVENGSPIPGGAGTKQMEFLGGQVYGQDINSGSWYTWNQQSWNPSAAPGGTATSPSSAPPPPPPPAAAPPPPPPPPPATAPPPSQDTIPVVTPGNGSFTDNSGNVYTISTNQDMAMINGGPIAGQNGENISSGTLAMAYDQGQIYGEDSSSWYVLSPKNVGPNTWEWHQATPPDLGVIQQELMH